MRRRFRPVLVLIPAFAAILPGLALDRGEDLLTHLLALEKQHAPLCPSTGGGVDLISTIDLIAKELRLATEGAEGTSRRIEAMNRALLTDLGIRGSPDLKDPCNLLPSGVLERKQGYCVGIAALYLILAERLDLPINAVATPSHVFLRYDDGRTRVNIETLQSGASVADEQYIREQKIPERSIRRGIFMRNLTTDEFLAQVHNNLGVVYSERKDYDAAAREYESALDLDPRLPAALYNWGNDLLREEQYRKAIRRFTKSLRLYPTDVWALNNRGLANLKMGKPDKARRDFEEALKIEPAFEQARRNLKGIKSPQ